MTASPMRDVQLAADVLRSVYDATHGRDGFVSLEVAADLAHETERTIAGRARVLEGGQARQRDDQDPRHARGRGRDRAGDL